MALSLDDIRMLFEQHGALAYSGEPVTQLGHALQTAQLAEQADAPDTLVAAALLHDLGHLLHPRAAAGGTPTQQGVDDLHQYYALPFLRVNFPDAVLEPIRLHVDAKRCLCAIDATYFSQLSPDSVRSLALQGGIFSDEEARTFRQQPYAEEALQLRRWDDLAKSEGCATPTLEHYLGVVQGVMRGASVNVPAHGR
jgi:phosphonate degradation associated HDIG domain protein